MTRINRFSSFLDRFDEQICMSTFRLKREFNEWIDERVGLVRAEVRQIKARFAVHNHHTAQVHFDDDEPRVETVSLEEFLVDKIQQQQHELATAAASTSTGRKRSLHSSASSTSAKKARTKKYSCKFPNCEKSFADELHLVMHEHTHLGIKPYSCTWLNCDFVGIQRYTVITHIRFFHFKLPKSIKQQQQLSIVDDRNPNDYIRVDQDLVNRRL